MSKLMALLLTGMISLESFAQMVPTPGPAPVANAPSTAPTAKPQALNLNLKGVNQCSFQPQLSSDDMALLENAKNAINVLRQNSKCAAMTSQFDAFQEALKAYNQQTGADRVPGYDGNLNVTCANYISIYDANFEFFADNWDDPGNLSSGNDMFYNCRNQSSRDEAIQCAAIVTGRNKNYKKSQCDAQKDAISAQAMGQLLNTTYSTGLQAVQAILNNNDCIDSAGEQKLSFIQSAVGIASRAASLGVLGTGVGLLIGAASEVVGSAIKNFFSGKARNRDHLAILDNRDNFTKIACLYEQIEGKALRCERISATKNVEALRPMYDKDLALCKDEEFLPNFGNLEIDRLIKRLKESPESANSSEAKPQGLSQYEFDALVNALNKNIPGTNSSRMDVGLRVTQDVIDDINQKTSSDDALRESLSKSDPGKKLTGSDLRSELGRLNGIKTQAIEVQKVLKMIQEVDAKGTSMQESDLKAAQDVMKSFEGGVLNFTGSFNSLMIQRATTGDDLSKQISAYMARVSEVNVAVYNTTLFRDQKAISENSFDDGGRFLEAKLAIRPHLEKVMDKELEALTARAKILTDIPVGTPTPTLKDNLRTQEEGVIYPLLRACSQLRSVKASDKKDGYIDVSADTEPAVCKVFDCQKGSQRFEDFLLANKINGADPKRCSTECKAHYDRYLCQQRSTLDRTRDAIQKEFLSNGTICGKSMSQAFGGLKKKDTVVSSPSSGPSN